MKEKGTRTSDAGRLAFENKVEKYGSEFQYRNCFTSKESSVNKIEKFSIFNIVTNNDYVTDNGLPIWRALRRSNQKMCLQFLGRQISATDPFSVPDT